jgi:predicted DNA-binding WGR domain protein
MNIKDSKYLDNYMDFDKYVEKVVLEHTEEGHYKFYHISRKQNEKSFLAQWGRIGNRPQSKVYHNASMWEQMLVKKRKGYKVKTYKLFGDHSEAYTNFMEWLGENDVELFD